MHKKTIPRICEVCQVSFLGRKGKVGKYCSNDCRHNGRRIHDGLNPQQRYRLKCCEIAKQFVNALRAKTVCQKCGCQPIEYHNKEHETQPTHRISYMVQVGRSIVDIALEIEKCQPLCRRCHQLLDGRIKNNLTGRRPCLSSL